LSIVIMRSEMRSIGCIIPIAVVISKGVNFHTSNSLKKRFSNKGRHFLNHSISVLHVEINAALTDPYTTSATLESLVGMASWWVEKKDRLLLKPIWTSFLNERLSINLIYILFILIKTTIRRYNIHVEPLRIILDIYLRVL
jgi:hypothetical protein